MSLLGIPVDKIVESDIQRLLNIGVVESPYLDYKQETYGGGDDDRSEFLADVSSFANTLGGDLVIGVAEARGSPTELTPFPGDADSEKRRLEQIALSGLEPRIGNLRIHTVPIATGGHIIVVRVPRSFIPPHRVVARNSNRFWARAGTTKYQPNVEQLRHLFNDVPHLADRIRSFQTDRLVKITAGDTPIPLNQLGKVVVHVMPLPSFADGRLSDIVSAITSGTHAPLPLDEIGFSNTATFNLDGYLNYTPRPHADARVAYAQFFRNGAIEAVGELSNENDGHSYFVGPAFTKLVIEKLSQYLQVLKSYDTGLPVYIFLSLCGTSQTYYRYALHGMGWNNTPPFGREIIALPEVYVDDFDADISLVMRPIFNMLWNAFGFQQCDMYDAQGQCRRVG